MGYQDFKTEDFIQDESFIKWVKNGDNQTFWEGWLKENPVQKQNVEEARAFILKLDFEQEKLATEKKARILENLHKQIETSKKTPLYSLTQNRIWVYSGVAVAALVFLFLFFRPDTNSVPANQYQTAFEESRQILLPDGTEVILNANSHLEILSDWEKEDYREVKLRGEAFFSVLSAADYGGKKFVVQAGDMQVEVLGTKFNVEQREEKFQVVLTEGKVQIYPSGNTQEEVLKLEPGEMASFNYDTETLSSREVNTRVYTSWQSEELFFDTTPLSDLIDILRYSYGYEVQIENPALLEKKLTGTLANGNPEILLRGLSKAFNIEVKHVGEKHISLRTRN